MRIAPGDPFLLRKEVGIGGHYLGCTVYGNPDVLGWIPPRAHHKHLVDERGDYRERREHPRGNGPIRRSKRNALSLR
jgi:hypothetical protein